MPDEWRDVVLKTIRESPSKNKPGTGYGLWVVMRVRNEKCYNVTLRAGGFWTKESTKEKVYPKEGMTDWDFEALSKKSENGPGFVWDEVKPLLDRKNPPPVPNPTAPLVDEVPVDEVPDVPW